MTEWLDFDIFSIHLASRIRRQAGEVNRELSVRIFADLYKLDESHVLAVINREVEPSQDLLNAVGAEAQIYQRTVYRFND